MRNILEKNKRGASATNFAIWLIAIILILALIFSVLALTGVINLSKDKDTGDDGGKTNPTACGDSTGKLTVNSYSALSKGTNVTPTLKVGINGGGVTNDATSGTTTYGIGENLVVVASLSDYIDTQLSGKMICGGLVIDNPMFYSTSDNPAIRMKNDDGDYMVDSSGGVVTAGINQTAVDAGDSIALTVEFKGTVEESSGEGVYIVETPASSSSNVSSVTLDGKTAVAVPTVHGGAVGAGSWIGAFDVSAVEGSTTDSYELRINLVSGKDYVGNTLTDWYSKQVFVDDNGQPATGIQDASGDAEYENHLDFDFMSNQ